MLPFLPAYAVDSLWLQWWVGVSTRDETRPHIKFKMSDRSIDLPARAVPATMCHGCKLHLALLLPLSRMIMKLQVLPRALLLQLTQLREQLSAMYGLGHLPPDFLVRSLAPSLDFSRMMVASLRQKETKRFLALFSNFGILFSGNGPRLVLALSSNELGSLLTAIDNIIVGARNHNICAQSIPVTRNFGLLGHLFMQSRAHDEG